MAFTATRIPAAPQGMAAVHRSGIEKYGLAD